MHTQNIPGEKSLVVDRPHIAVLYFPLKTQDYAQNLHTIVYDVHFYSELPKFCSILSDILYFSLTELFIVTYQQWDVTFPVIFLYQSIWIKPGKALHLEQRHRLPPCCTSSLC